MADPFDVLGIDCDADEEAVREAYRRQVKEAHPDHGGSVEEFKRVRAAYERIRDGEVDDEGGSEVTAGERRRNPEPEPTRVEYLNYEALDDFGWRLDDDDLFAKAGDADLDPVDHGRFLVQPGESLLEAAESRGFAWPFACRGGACANCAVAMCEGEVSMPVNHVLPDEMMDRGFRLSCNAMPATDELRVVYNVKHLPGLDELRLPPRPFRQAHAGD